MPRILTALLIMLLNLEGTPSVGANAAPAVSGPVVSGSLASDEILVEIFKDQNQDQLVLSPMADNPSYSNIINIAAKIPKRWHNSAESLIALKPRLVILASYNNPTLKARLTQAKVVFIELQKFDRLIDIRENIAAIGAAVDRQAATQTLLQQFDATMLVIEKNRAQLSIPPKLISYSPSLTPGGKGTLIDDIITTAGGVNLPGQAGLAGWSKLNAEVLATMQPDYIIIAEGEKTRADFAEQITRDPVWKHMKAVQTKKFIFINQAQLLAVSHHALDAVSMLQKHLTGLSHDK